MRKPFYRRDRSCWYVKTPNGNNQVRLHEDESEAYRIWNEMILAERPEVPNATVAVIAENFLQYCERRIKASTLSSYSRYLADFCDVCGRMPVRELKSFHVTKWLHDKPNWGVASQRYAIISIKRCLNWAVQEGLITRNPLVGVKRPKGRRREVLISDGQHFLMMRCPDAGRQPGQRAAKLRLTPKSRDACFRQVLMALKHFGARPGSVANVQIEDVAPDCSSWVLREHKTRDKTGAPLVVYLSPCLQTLTRIAKAGRTSGPLFINSQGQAWTSNAIRCRMKQLRRKLDLPHGTVAYAYRHTYATRALMNGTDLATVAELLGHGDLKMLAQHYGHLDKQKEHLKQAAARAVRTAK